MKLAWSVFLACLLAAACLLILLGHRPLADWDEAIYAGVSKEMLSGHFLSPTWRFQNFLEKPPLYMWLTAAFFRIFGTTEFWARAASAFSGIAVIGILHAVVARVRGLRAAWLSTVILLTMRGFLRAGRVGELDMLLTLGCCLSLWGIHRIRNANLQGWYLFWIGLAIALMTKSAASGVIVVTLLVLIVWERWPLSIFRAKFFAGAVLFLLLVAPWHLYMWHRFGAAFWHEYLWVQVFARSTAQLDRHYNPPWFYIEVLAAYASPWLLFLPFALVDGIRKKELREFSVFALVVFILFSVARTRLLQYIVPIYPVLAVATASWIDERTSDWFADRAANHKRSRHFRFGVALAIALLVSVLIANPVLRHLPGREAVGRGEEDARWLLPLLRHESDKSVNEPVLLCMEGDWLPVPAAVFYTGKRLQQVYIHERPDTSGTAHRYYADPQPLADFVDASPRLLVIDKRDIDKLPASMRFYKIRQDGQLELGTITLVPGATSQMQ